MPRHRRSRRNPGYDPDFTHHFRKGGSIELFNDGEVCVYDQIGNEENYFLKPAEIKRLKQDILDSPFAAWHHYTIDMIRGEYAFQGRGGREMRNPRHRKHSRRSRRSRRAHHSKGSRRAKRSQNRRGIRASSRGFRRAKRHGRTRVTTRKFMKLRRHARNPWARPGENEIPTVRITRGGGRGRRNPEKVYHRTLRDGSKITVREGGDVVVHDEKGREYDSYHLKPWEVNRFLADLGGRRFASKEGYRYDSMSDVGEYHSLSRNPRRGRGRCRNPSGQFPMPFRSALNPRRRRGRGRHRRNPAQFPAPFVSAMNPRRRRNAPISARDARSMKRVLRQHRYSCR